MLQENEKLFSSWNKRKEILIKLYRHKTNPVSNLVNSWISNSKAA